MESRNDYTPMRRKTVQHFDEPGDAHFLTFSCYRRMSLLSKDRTRRWLAEAINAARERHHFDLWAWVFMPEHVHLLVRPRRPDWATGRVLADIKRPVGQKAIGWLRDHEAWFLPQLTVRNHGRTYHRFWQAGPGQDHNVFDVATAHSIVEYIHNNSVKRGLVACPEAWLWSSAFEWAGMTDVVLRIDRTLPTLMEGLD